MLRPQVARVAAAAPQAVDKGVRHDAHEPLRSARRALSTVPAEPARSRTFAQILSAGPGQRHDVPERPKLAGAALLVPQGGASSVVLRPARQRCAVLAARWCLLARCVSACCLRVAQGRLWHPGRARPRFWALSAPTLQAVHDHLRLVHATRRGEECGHAARASHNLCPLSNGGARSVALVGCTCDHDSDLGHFRIATPHSYHVV